jgi:hypothetical protein
MKYIPVYRITVVLKVETDIITSISVRLIGRAAIILIMFDVSSTTRLGTFHTHFRV